MASASSAFWSPQNGVAILEDVTQTMKVNIDRIPNSAEFWTRRVVVSTILGLLE